MLSTEKRPETLALIGYLATIPVGDTAFFDGLSHVAGRDIRRCRHFVYSATRWLQTNRGMVFSGVRGVGYKRLPPAEVIAVGSSARVRIRRIARKTAATMAAGLDGANDLTNEQRLKALAEQSAMAMLEHMSRDRNQPVFKVDDDRPLSVAEMAAAMLKAMK